MLLMRLQAEMVREGSLQLVLKHIISSQIILCDAFIESHKQIHAQGSLWCMLVFPMDILTVKKLNVSKTVKLDILHRDFGDTLQMYCLRYTVLHRRW